MKLFKSIKKLASSVPVPAHYTQVNIALEQTKADYLKLEHQCVKRVITALEGVETHLIYVLGQPNLYQWQRSLNECELFKVRAEINHLKVRLYSLGLLS